MNKQYAKIYQNELTMSIRNGITFDDLILHKELAITARNEASELMNFFFPEEEMKKPEPNLLNLDKLISIALEPSDEGKIISENKTSDNKEIKNILYQKSRNASNLLSEPSTKFQAKLQQDNSKRLFKALRNFIFSKYNRNIIFSGHFQRIFDQALRKSQNILLDKQFYKDEFNEKFLSFLIINSDLLSYRELLMSILSEFTNCFPNALDETLRYATIAIIHYRDGLKSLKQKENEQNKAPPEIKPRTSLETQIETHLTAIIENQPVNCKREKIQTPYFMTKKFKIESKYIKDDRLINKLKSLTYYDDIKFSDLIHSSNKLDDNEIDISYWQDFAHNLVNIFKNTYDLGGGAQIQKKIDHDMKFSDSKIPDIIRYLLACGMFADPNSSLPYISFNLVFNLLNKPHTDSDGSFDNKYILNMHILKNINEFADYFYWDPYNVSEKMIAGLLVFWNHHYKDFKKDKGPEIPGFKPKEGATPLQFLLPSILTEPIFSSKLVNIFLRIISSMQQTIIDTIEKDIKRLIQDQGQQRTLVSHQLQREMKKAEEKCFKFDSIWYELITYKFKLQPDDEDEVTLPQALEKLLPLPTTNKFYDKFSMDSIDVRRFRAPTNPVFFILSNIISHGAFFSYKEGVIFQKYVKIPFSKDWAKQTFKYCHIIERMERQLVNIPYEKHNQRNILVDESSNDEEIIDQEKYIQNLSDSGSRFKI